MTIRRLSPFVVALAVTFLAPVVVRAQGAITDGATAQCTDGSWSTAASQKGACSGHQGVKKWIGKKPKGATARCNDGEYWTAAAEQGACSGHGGVLMRYKPAKSAKKK